MNGREGKIRFLYAAGIWIIGAQMVAVMTFWYCSRQLFYTLGAVCTGIIKKAPEMRQFVLQVLKEYDIPRSDENILSYYGYGPSDFFHIGRIWMVMFILLAAGGILALFLGARCKNRKLLQRIDELTEYLEKVNRGESGMIHQIKEDEFSLLEDEIYKTVTMLKQTKDQALKAKEHYAGNLANIAHQLKTPITAISLLVQTANNMVLEKKPEPQIKTQIKNQLARLTRLEESLLVLSRIDAGTLILEKKPVDIFTLLTLSADSMEELFVRAGVQVMIPEGEEAVIWGDMEWTMEAVMNILKNSMEHSSPDSRIFCTYGSNALYVWIRIEDQGPGFLKEDLPHVFERFYRGKQEKCEGIGIGLSLAKELIEMENGTIAALNIPGGACFEIHFYKAWADLPSQEV